MATPYPIPASVPFPHGASDARGAANRGVAAWLFVCCALVFAMVVVGGVTRLTHSGLSITEWQPIVGTVPPLSDAQWQEAFAKYKLTPEYRQINTAMTLAGFKGIFWWEYAHRLLGRVIGLAFLIPLVWFVAWRRISSALAAKLIGILALGAVQGALGWYMVQSGLVDDPRVSPFRLSAHLGLAFAILAAMLWTAMTLRRPQRAALEAPAQRTTRRLAFFLAALVFVMVLSGALVAGIRAVQIYPHMRMRVQGCIQPSPGSTGVRCCAGDGDRKPRVVKAATRAELRIRHDSDKRSAIGGSWSGGTEETDNAVRAHSVADVL